MSTIDASQPISVNSHHRHFVYHFLLRSQSVHPRRHQEPPRHSIRHHSTNVAGETTVSSRSFHFRSMKAAFSAASCALRFPGDAIGFQPACVRWAQFLSDTEARGWTCLYTWVGVGREEAIHIWEMVYALLGYPRDSDDFLVLLAAKESKCFLEFCC